MTFDLDAEQRAFADQVERLFEQGGGAARRGAMTDAALVSALQPPGLWSALAAQGVLGINVPAALGGSASSARDAALRTHIVMHAIGRHLALEPFVSSAVVGASLIAEVAEASLQQLMLPVMMKGRVRLTPAVLEADDPGNLRHVATRATNQPNAWVLEGRKIGILDAPDANWMILSARTSGNATDEGGISLFLVSRTARGVEMQYGRGPDGSEIASATLRGVMVATNDLIGTPGQGYAPLERAMQRGIAALCSEAAGIMDRLLSMCGTHLDACRQSGLAPASLPALQQRVAALQSAAEQAHSATRSAVAAIAMDAAPADEVAVRRKALANAKASAGMAARLFDQEALQLMAGAGAANELIVDHCVRRLMVIDATWGNVEHHTAVQAGLMA